MHTVMLLLSLCCGAMAVLMGFPWALIMGAWVGGIVDGRGDPDFGSFLVLWSWGIAVGVFAMAAYITFVAS